jgi:hypothetical protein
MPILGSIEKLFFKKNLLSLVFSPMTRVLINPDSNSVAAVFKMNMKSNITVFADESKTQSALELVIKDMIHTEWELNDMEKGGETIALVKMNRLKSIMRFGKEDFSIKKPDGSEWMTLTTDSSTADHILDNMTALYNPSHTYQIKSANDSEIALITTKAGFFHQRYDFSLVGGSESEKKVALAVFAVISLMLRK